MHWQFGGNFEPVRIICEIDWRECPAAIINYVWSEIVTDVIDCLTNEAILWKVIVLLVICALIAHLLYLKTRRMFGKSDNTENLDVVGCKVQDLELRVNILTYKMQYGTWPLPHQIRHTGIDGRLKNVRFTLSNSKDRTAWLKHTLLSPSEHRGYVRHAKIGPRSVHCLTKLLNLETKYMASRFVRDNSPASSESISKYSRSNSEKSIEYRSSLKNCLEVDDAEMNLIRRGKDVHARSKEIQRYTNNCRSETRILEYHEPLNMRKQSALKNVEKRDLLAKNDDHVIINETIVRQQSNSNCEDKQSIKDKADVINELENLKPKLDSVESDASGNFHDSDPHRELMSKDNIDLIESSPDNEASPRTTKAKMLNENEMSRNSDDKWNDASLHETFRDKKVVLVRSEEVKEENTNEDTAEKIDVESSDEFNERPWSEFKYYFQSKLLDIISEEQSAASSTDKAGRNRVTPEIRIGTEKAPENESSREEYSIDTADENLDKSELTLTMNSSEYFSLNNSEERFEACSTTSMSPRDIPMEICSDCTNVDKVKGDLHKDINDLVNQSVQNIHDYAEVFPYVQNEGIEETKKPIIDKKIELLPRVSECSSDDSITHFASAVEVTDSIIEELPPELSVLSINSLVDSEELSLEQNIPGDSSIKADFALKRRPGSISLAEKQPDDNNATLDSRLLVESTNPQVDQLENENIGETTVTFFEEPSCTELLMDYLLESDSDFVDDRLPSTLNLIEFENTTEVKENVQIEDTRGTDSPLTGRTVICLNGSFATNLKADSMPVQSIDRTDSAEFKSAADASDDTSDSDGLFTPESLNTEERLIPVTVPEISPLIDNVTQETMIPERKSLDVEIANEKQETNGSPAIKDEESLNKSSVASTILQKSEKIVNNCIKTSDKSHEVKSPRNLSSDSSGMYTDTDSRDLLHSSGTSLSFDKYILNPPANRIEITALKKSIQEINCSSVQRQIPWNAPKIDSYLSNSRYARSKTFERLSSKLDKPKEPGAGSKPQRLRSSIGNQIKSRSNLNLASSRDTESSKSTAAPRTPGKSGIDPSQRRSRSYATPPKSEIVSRNSTTIRSADTNRQSRTRWNCDRVSKTYQETIDIDKSTLTPKTRPSSRSCATSVSSKSCIPILRRAVESMKPSNSETRTKSPKQSPLAKSTSSQTEEPEGNSDFSVRDVQMDEHLEEKEVEDQDDGSASALSDNRTVVYVNIVTDREHGATTRVVDPKQFLEYLKDRDLKIQNILDTEGDAESSIVYSTKPSIIAESPRILTVVSSAVNGNLSSDRSLIAHTNSSGITDSWTSRVQQREIQVSARPSVIDTSTSISDLQLMSVEKSESLGQFQIFEVPKELTKEEYIILLEALNKDPNLNQLREMDKLCNKLGLGFDD